MELSLSRGPAWLLALVSALGTFAMLFVGFRLFYDSVIPEVAGLVAIAGILAFARPAFSWLWIAAILAGLLLSERVFPATPPLAHVARYGPPKPVDWLDLVKIALFPAAGSIVGAGARLVSGVER